MENSQATTQIKAAEPKEKRGFSLFGGLREGIVRRRSLKEALSLLAEATDANEPERLARALEAFRALPQKEQGQVMLKAQSRVRLHSISPFERQESLTTITVLAGFFYEAAKTLPRGPDGERDTAPYEKARAALRSVVEKSEFKKRGDGSHDAAVLACTMALWELELGSFQFWEDRLLDPITRNYTMTKLLEMEPTENPKEHGWHLLMEHLQSLGPEIALCGSRKKADFLAAALNAPDRQIVKSAMASAFYLDVPDLEVSAIISSKETEPGMRESVGLFLEAMHLKAKWLGGEDRFIAGHRLIELSHDAKYIVPFLYQMGADALKSALEACGDESPEGIRRGEMPIIMLTALAANDIYPYDAESLGKVLGSIVGLGQAARAFYAWTGAIIADKEASRELRSVALLMQEERIRNLEDNIEAGSDMDVLNSGYELLDLYVAGNAFLQPMLAKAGAEALDMFLDPAGETDGEKISKKKLAIDMLVRMGLSGISVPGFELKIEKEEGSGGARGRISANVIVKEVTVGKDGGQGQPSGGTGDSG